MQLCGGVWQDSDQIGQGKYVMAHRLRDAERESSRRAGRRRHRTESVAGVREAAWGSGEWGRGGEGERRMRRTPTMTMQMDKKRSRKTSAES